PAAAPSEGGQQVVTWYYFDQNNTDEQANERVGNTYMRESIEKFNADFAGKFTLENQPQGYDLTTKLVTAVQSGGDAPDVMAWYDADLRLYMLNNTIQDVEWAKSEPWFADLDPNAVEACTVDGKLMCVPIAQSPWLVAYYTDMYKDGFPKTPEALLEASAALKADGKYAMTYWANTAFDGEATSRYFFMALSSFGGGYDDGTGKMLLNRPENVEAISFMRQIATGGYSPEAVFAGNFEEEQSFKQGTAGAFPVSYAVARNYLHPLTSPDGQVFDSNSPQDIEDAVAAGALGAAPFVAPEGQTPGCTLQLYGLVVPRTAKNLEGAKSYINWVMTAPNTTDWIARTNGGLPTSKALQTDPAFNGPLARQAVEAASASACRPWYGSLAHIPEAKALITKVIYDLLKTDPTADIATALTATQDEYNSQFP
ncbi:MAG: extracellular solute-binding protein, partial [Roseiflexaceae bacterium]|nr:extracellular solute-binding protein [Roseiflexaceae bacterium]